MKTKFDCLAVQVFFVSLLLSLPSLCASGQDLRKADNYTFQRGEKLEYRLYYDNFLPGYVTIGDASINIAENNVEIAGRNTMHIVGTAKSRRFFNLFFKINNRYETYIDEEAIVPWHFMRDVYEGGYERNESITFNQYENKAYTKGEIIPTTENIQDIISAFYFVRTLDYSNVKHGDKFDINFLFKDSIYVARIIFEGRETIKTKMGEIKTLRFKPQVLTEEGFEQSWPMTLWISDDKNRIPVLFETRVIIGFAKIELVRYYGLKNPFNAKKRP